MWGSCGVGELHCGGVAVWGICSVGYLRCGAFAVWGIRGVGLSRCGAVAAWGSCIVAEMHYLGVIVVTKPEFIAF